MIARGVFISLLSRSNLTRLFTTSAYVSLFAGLTLSTTGVGPATARDEPSRGTCVIELLLDTPSVLRTCLTANKNSKNVTGYEHKNTTKSTLLFNLSLSFPHFAFAFTNINTL